MENNAVRKYPSHQLSAPRWRPSSCGLLCTASAALYQECSRLPNTARPVLHHLRTSYPKKILRMSAAISEKYKKT